MWPLVRKDFLGKTSKVWSIKGKTDKLFHQNYKLLFLDDSIKRIKQQAKLGENIAHHEADKGFIPKYVKNFQIYIFT